MNMDKKDIIKYALIAAAVYLVYRWAQTSGVLAGIMGTATGTGTQVQPGTYPVQQIQPPQQTQQPVQPVQAQAPAPVQAAPVQPVVVPSDAALMKAAYNSTDSGLAGNYRLNLHQWNWYRTQAAIAATGASVQAVDAPYWDSIADPNALYTAAEYHALRTQAGLSGVSGWSTGLGSKWGVQ